jgi:hypothetical protein
VDLSERCISVHFCSFLSGLARCKRFFAAVWSRAGWTCISFSDMFCRTSLGTGTNCVSESALRQPLKIIPSEIHISTLISIDFQVLRDINCHITMDRSTIFHGNTHYFDWAIFYVAMWQITRGSIHTGTMDPMVEFNMFTSLQRKSLQSRTSKHLKTAMSNGGKWHNEEPQFSRGHGSVAQLLYYIMKPSNVGFSTSDKKIPYVV